MEIDRGEKGKIRISRKRIAEGIFFLLVMALSFYTVFRDQDMENIVKALQKLSPWALCLALLVALFFVSAEGIMIYYLLHSMNGRSSLLRCISYSFIGFFYSGITPSATGGQPMQLYYMRKDHNRLSEASVVLMTVALIYKFVLVLIGIGMLVFWYRPLKTYLNRFFSLYLLGLGLNLILVLAIMAVMLMPDVVKKTAMRAETLLVRIGLLKSSVQRTERIERFVEGYRDAVRFLIVNRRKVLNVCLFTFVQRASVFILTWIIYRGFALEGADVLTVSLLQASVYIAVDMLPVPGAQGITELMYRNIYGAVFTGGYLMPSLYVTRGISFYFLLLAGAAVIAGRVLFERRRSGLLS